MSTPPSPQEFEAALRRIELGTATASDAQLIREYVATIEDGCDYFREELRVTREALQKERESSAKFQHDLDWALNFGPGFYKP